MTYLHPRPQEPAEPREPQDPQFITVKESCRVIGGSKPISTPTFYRDPELRALIEHPSPGISRIRRPKLLALLNARTARSKEAL
jgi:hypothetical protein